MSCRCTNSLTADAFWAVSDLRRFHGYWQTRGVEGAKWTGLVRCPPCGGAANKRKMLVTLQHRTTRFAWRYHLRQPMFSARTTSTQVIEAELRLHRAR